MDRFWETNGGRLMGLAIGLVLGLIYLIVGFWKTMGFGAFLLAGYLVGKQLDDHDGFKEMLETVNPGKWLRR